MLAVTVLGGNYSSAEIKKYFMMEFYFSKNTNIKMFMYEFFKIFKT